MEKQIYQNTPKESLERLDSRLDGLEEKEIKKRQQKYGLNVLPKKNNNPWWLILSKQFRSFLIYILFLASGLSFYFGHPIDAYVILAVVFLNVIIGFFQEYRAEKSVQALQDLLVPQAKVFRAGDLQKIPSPELVPGDIILIEEGDKIGADCRILSAKNFQVIESSLTGESRAVVKQSKKIIQQKPLAERNNMVFMGTFATTGEATAIVVETGARTEIGKIATDLQDIKEEDSHFLQQTNLLTKQIGSISIGLSALVFIIGYFVRDFELFDILLFSIATLVSGIPEGLPAVLAIVLALGARRIAQQKVIVRKLPAIETLGAVTTICTDKTGTLTENTMTVKGLWLSNNQEFEVTGSAWDPIGKIKPVSQKAKTKTDYKLLGKLLKIGFWGQQAEVDYDSKKPKIVGDPTEASLYVLGKKAGFEKDNIYDTIDDLPFSSENKFRATLVKNRDHNQKIIFSIGAPEILLSRINASSVLQKNIEDQIHNFNKRGYRTLTLCYKNTDLKKETVTKKDIYDLEIAGLVAIQDPVRKGVKNAILKAKRAGVRVIMMTGDHAETAKNIAKEIGLISDNRDIVCDQSKLNKVNPKKFSQIVKTCNVFSRMTPKMKLLITTELQKQGQIVAMTGDGVNDAPALKKADVGISMGLIGTDVAREASEIVLSDDQFTSIVSAIEQGRIVFNNIRKSSYYLLSTNIAEMATILVSLFIGLPAPLTATQILWMNLVTDGVNGIALASEPGNKKEMLTPPRSPEEGILTRSVLPFILMMSSLMTVGAIFIFKVFDSDSIEKARTGVLLVLSLTQLFNMINMKDLALSAFRKSIFNNPTLIFAFFLSFGLALSAVYLPFVRDSLDQVSLSLSEFVIILAISIFGLWLGEAYKFIHSRFKRNPYYVD